MALKAMVDTLDAVPEEARGFYVQGDSGYRLAVEGVEFPEQVAGLKSALEKEREARKALEGKFAQMPEDFDPSRWKQLTEAEQKREEELALARGEFDKVKQRMEEQARQKEERLTSQLDRKVRDQALVQAAAEHDGYTHLLPEHATKFVQVREEAGERVAVVVDEKGEARLNADGSRMSVSQLVSWMKEQERYWPLFRGQGIAGGGAAGGSGAGGARKSLKDMSDFEKAQYVQQHGLEKYLGLLNDA
jgi:hypothetical protein